MFMKDENLINEIFELPKMNFKKGKRIFMEDSANYQNFLIN